MAYLYICTLLNCNFYRKVKSWQHKNININQVKSFVSLNDMTELGRYCNWFKEKVKKCFFLVRTLGIYSQQFLYITFSNVNWFIMLYTTSLLLIFIINGILYLLTAFIQCLLPPPPLVTTHVFLYEFVCFFLVYNIVIQYFYILQNDHHNNSNYHVSPHQNI